MYLRQSTVEVRVEDGVKDVTITLHPEDERAPGELREEVSSIDNSEVAALLESGDDGFATGEFVWGASGVIPVLDTADGLFFALGKRDGGAPSHQHHLATASGMTDTWDELFYPRDAGVREGIEEIIYSDFDGTAYAPCVGSYSEDDVRELVEEARSAWESVPDDVGLFNPPEEGPPASPTDVSVEDGRLESLGEDSLTIVDPEEGRENTVEGNIVLDPEASAIDIIDMMVVDLTDHSLEDLLMLDGEVVGDNIVNRSVYLFTPEQIRQATIGGEAEYHRFYKTGRCWDGSDWADQYEDGVEGSIEEFKIVPNLESSISEALDALSEK